MTNRLKRNKVSPVTEFVRDTGSMDSVHRVCPAYNSKAALLGERPPHAPQQSVPRRLPARYSLCWPPITALTITHADKPPTTSTGNKVATQRKEQRDEAQRLHRSCYFFVRLTCIIGCAHLDSVQFPSITSANSPWYEVKGSPLHGLTCWRRQHG